MMLVVIVIRTYSHSLYVIIILDTFWYFSFSIPCILIHLLQFEPTNAHNFIKVTILQHIIPCIFQSWLVCKQGEHSCTNIFLIFSACNRAAESSSVYVKYVVDRIVRWTKWLEQLVFLGPAVVLHSISYVIIM